MEFSCYAPYRGVTGYDFVSRGFIKDWDRQGHDVSLLEFDKWSNLRAFTEIDHILAKMEKAQVNPSFHINFCLVDQCKLNLGIKNVCYTMFEADRVSPLWVKEAEKLDLIIVPTEFSRKSFITSGVSERKVHVCPVPLDIDRIKAAKSVNLYSYSGENIMNYKHRFLNMSEYIARKNVDMLIRAWCDETKDTDDACLVLKLNSNSGVKLDFFQKKINELVRNKKSAPIFLLTDFLTEQTCLSLYASCTHYISASFGEGWGVGESICGVMGKRLIAPASTSFLDYLTKENSYQIMVQPVGATQDGPVGHYYQGSRWFAPIFFSVRKNIRNSIKEANEGENTKGKLLSEKLINLADSRKVGNQILDIINNFEPSRKTLPTVVKADNDFNWLMICKSLGSKCGIADYTLKLYNGSNTPENKELFSNNLLIRGEAIEYGEILEHNNVHVTNLQLEYQFITPQRLKLLLQYQNNTNIVPTVTMHTVNPRAWDYHEVLIENKANIVVSSNEMRNALTSKCGFTPEKVKVIPMGMDGTNIGTAQKREDKNFRIGFFGFTYFHKGIDKLLKYMDVYGREDKQCLILSTKPENDQTYYNKIYKQYTETGVNTQWITEYLEEPEIVNALTTCDLIFLPYSPYGGLGVSAAVRTCLKAGVPIVGFNNEFFRDVVHENGLITFIGDNPNNFTEWSENLNKFISEMKSNIDQVKQDYIIKRDKFIQDFSWNKVSELYLKHFQDLLREANKCKKN